MTDVIENKLQTMYDENQPDPAFAEQLEQELRRMHMPTTPARPVQPRNVKIMRRIAAIAASFVIILGLFATVPPLRSFAQDLLAQLFPTTDEDRITIAYNDLGMPEEFPTLDALREGVPYELIALGELPAGLIESTFFLYYPDRNVATQYYHIVTIQQNIAARLHIWLSQQPIADSQSSGLFAFGFDLVLPDDIETQLVLLDDDTQAELVRGMWVETGEMDADGNELYRWKDDFWHFSLRWQDTEYVYEVAVMPSSQITADEIETILLDLTRGMISD